MINQDFDKWKIKDGARSGQIMPGNCFYIYDESEMKACVYKKKDAERIIRAVNNHNAMNESNMELLAKVAAEITRLREENNLLSKEIGEKDELNEGLRLSRNEYMQGFERAQQEIERLKGLLLVEVHYRLLEYYNGNEMAAQGAMNKFKKDNQL